jgi:transcriptional activator SPT7
VTDIASDFLTRLIGTYKLYQEQPKREVHGADANTRKSSVTAMDLDTPILAPSYTLEERVLHTLDENGMDLDGLESYVRDDVERLGSKLGVMHERMKSHLADLFVSRIAAMLIFGLFH